LGGADAFIGETMQEGHITADQFVTRHRRPKAPGG